MPTSEKTRMRITTVRLPEDLAEAVDREAERQGVSASEFVREGVILRLAVAVAARSAGGLEVAAIVDALTREP